MSLEDNGYPGTPMAMEASLSLFLIKLIQPTLRAQNCARLQISGLEIVSSIKMPSFQNVLVELVACHKDNSNKAYKVTWKALFYKSNTFTGR